MNLEWSSLAGVAWMADATARISLILAVALVLDFAVRRRSAGIRHALWAATLIGVLAVPALAWLLPGIPLPILPATAVAAADPTRPAPTALPSLAEPALTSDTVARPAATSPGDDVPRAGSGTTLREAQAPQGLRATNGGGPVEVLPAPSGTTRRNRAGLLIVVWALGAVLALVQLGRGLYGLARITRRGTRANGVVEHLSGRVAASLGLRRRVRVSFSDELDTPLTWGSLRPVVLLPEDARHWSVERLRVVLLHELVHVREWHWTIYMAGRVAAGVYWFHPLVWFALRRLRLERERACDETVLDHGLKPSDYATHLVDIARALVGRTAAPAAGLTLARRGQLERRLEVILQPRRPTPVTVFSIALILSTAAGLIATVAAVEPEPVARGTGLAADHDSDASHATGIGNDHHDATSVTNEHHGTGVGASSIGPGTEAGRAGTGYGSSASGIGYAGSPGTGAAYAGRPAAMSAYTGSGAGDRASESRRIGGFSGTIHTSDGGTFSYRSGYENGDAVLERRDGDFLMSVRIEEPEGVELSSDGRRILSMDRHSVVTLRTASGDARQRLEITSGSDREDLQYEWQVDGRERAFDDEGREWMALVMEVANGFREASELRGRESSLRGQISSIRGHRSSLKGKISSIHGRRSSLNGKISSIHGHVSSMKGRISSIRGHESSLRGKISSLNGKISTLNAQRRRASGSNAEMRQLADKMNGMIDAEIEQIREQIRAVEDEIEHYDAAGRIREVERELESYDAEGRVREVEREIEDLDVEGRVREIEREIEDLDVEGRVRDIEREIEVLDARNRADAIQRRVEPKYEDLKRLSRRMG